MCVKGRRGTPYSVNFDRLYKNQNIINYGSVINTLISIVLVYK